MCWRVLGLCPEMPFDGDGDDDDGDGVMLMLMEFRNYVWHNSSKQCVKENVTVHFF